MPTLLKSTSAPVLPPAALPVSVKKNTSLAENFFIITKSEDRMVAKDNTRMSVPLEPPPLKSRLRREGEALQLLHQQIQDRERKYVIKVAEKTEKWKQECAARANQRKAPKPMKAVSHPVHEGRAMTRHELRLQAFLVETNSLKEAEHLKKKVGKTLIAQGNCIVYYAYASSNEHNEITTQSGVVTSDLENSAAPATKSLAASSLLTMLSKHRLQNCLILVHTSSPRRTAAGIIEALPVSILLKLLPEAALKLVRGFLKVKQQIKDAAEMKRRREIYALALIGEENTPETTAHQITSAGHRSKSPSFITQHKRELLKETKKQNARALHKAKSEAALHKHHRVRKTKKSRPLYSFTPKPAPVMFDADNAISFLTHKSHIPLGQHAAHRVNEAFYALPGWRPKGMAYVVQSSRYESLEATQVKQTQIDIKQAQDPILRLSRLGTANVNGQNTARGAQDRLLNEMVRQEAVSLPVHRIQEHLNTQQQLNLITYPHQQGLHSRPVSQLATRPQSRATSPPKKPNANSSIKENVYYEAFLLDRATDSRLRKQERKGWAYGVSLAWRSLGVHESHTAALHELQNNRLYATQVQYLAQQRSLTEISLEHVKSDFLIAYRRRSFLVLQRIRQDKINALTKLAYPHFMVRLVFACAGILLGWESLSWQDMVATLRGYDPETLGRATLLPAPETSRSGRRSKTPVKTRGMSFDARSDVEETDVHDEQHNYLGGLMALDDMVYHTPLVHSPEPEQAEKSEEAEEEPVLEDMMIPVLAEDENDLNLLGLFGRLLYRINTFNVSTEQREGVTRILAETSLTGPHMRRVDETCYFILRWLQFTVRTLVCWDELGKHVQEVHIQTQRIENGASLMLDFSSSKPPVHNSSQNPNLYLLHIAGNAAGIGHEK